MNSTTTPTEDHTLQIDTAILFAGWGPTPLGMPGELVPLLGRPMLQRAVEYLVRSGCSRIHVALGESALPVKTFLGDGTRWGCHVHYHTPSADDSLSHLARRIQLAPNRHYVLASAAALPMEPASSLPGALAAKSVGRILCHRHEDKERWTGWGIVLGEWLLAQEVAMDHGAIGDRVLATTEMSRTFVECPLSAAGLARLLEANERLLAEEGRTGKNGLPNGRGRQIHPDAKIVPPVYLGRHVKIGAHAVVGPNVALGEGVLVDREAHVEHSLILPDTYVGEGVQLIGAIAHGNRLANARLDTVVKVADPNLLSGLAHRPSSDHVPWAERIVADGLRVLLAPVQALLSVRKRMAVTSPWAVHFHDVFYPGLRQIAQGRLRMVGPVRRTSAEIRRLPQVWQDLYEQHSCGLLSEALLLDAGRQTLETRFASDALACASQGDKQAMFRLTGAYLGKALRNIFPISSQPKGEDNASAKDAASNIYHDPVR